MTDVDKAVANFDVALASVLGEKAQVSFDPKYAHYYKPVPYTHVDVYRVLMLFGVTDPCVQHAIKKLLVPGGRGSKDRLKDLHEAVVSINRAIAMSEEDTAARGSGE